MHYLVRAYRRTHELVIFLVIFFGFFIGLSIPMGLPNMLNTFMNTAYKLLLDTVFYIMAITVMTGAISKLFVEFGVVVLLEKMLKPLMKPLYNLPGVASLGAVMTFLSDNPAIITLSKDKTFSQYFKQYQIASLTNFGTSFGMGLVVVAFMTGRGYGSGALVGLAGAFIGSIVTTRMMQFLTLRAYPELDSPMPGTHLDQEFEPELKPAQGTMEEEKKGPFLRTLNAMLDGGKSGVEIGLSIIPGVLIISTIVMMTTFGAPADGVYTGSAYEGVPVLPWLASKIDFVFQWLFGFDHPELIAFPITALGAVGAAIGLIPAFDASGLITANAIAVFTAMGMCWSGFLSTHTGMLDSLGYRQLISKAIASHTVGGLIAGISAHWLFVLVSMI
ncbi:MAG: hypothetical protein IKP54_10450 [Bacteroidales bacterium]|nr:hypothetical protein [Bacteroidota bacterium]MBR6064560.1 hypothetical protein [Bacteroidales bacterium]